MTTTRGRAMPFTLTSIGVAALLLVLATGGDAGTVPVLRIDTSMVLPGGESGEKFDFIEDGVIDGNTVAFVSGGSTSGMPPGTGTHGTFVQTGAGPASAVVHTSPTTFHGHFESPSAHGGRVAVVHVGPSGRTQRDINLSQRRILLGRGGGIYSAIAYANDMTSSHRILRSPSLAGGAVAFYAESNGGGIGIHHWMTDSTGVHESRIVAIGDTAPGGGQYMLVPQGNPAFVPHIDGSGRVVFSSYTSFGMGIFAATRQASGGWQVDDLVGVTTPIPDGNETFFSFWNPGTDPDGDNVVFVGASKGSTPAEKGVYVLEVGSGNAPTVVADLSTPVPGGSGSFRDFRNASISGENVVFQGRRQNGSWGIYARIDGALKLIFDGQMNLSGTPVTGWYLGPDAISGRRILFRADHGGNSQALWVAEGTPAFFPGVANGDFNSGLGSWTVSGGGSAAVETGGGESWVSLQTNANPEVLEQTGVVTPPVPFTIGFDYRFTTSGGRLEVFLDATLLIGIDAPATVSSTFTRVTVEVTDPALLGLTNATLTFKLHRGSLAVLLLDEIGVRRFELPDTTVAAKAFDKIDVASLGGVLPTDPLVALAEYEGDPQLDPLDRPVAFAVARSVFGGYTSAGAEAFGGSGNGSVAAALVISHYRVVSTGQDVVPVTLGLDIGGVLDLEHGGIVKAGVHAAVYSARLEDPKPLFGEDVQRLGIVAMPSLSLVPEGDWPDASASAYQITTRGDGLRVEVSVHREVIVKVVPGDVLALHYIIDASAYPSSDADSWALADFADTLEVALSSSVPGVTFERVLPGDDPGTPPQQTDGITADLAGKDKLSLKKIAKDKDAASMSITLADDGTWTCTDGNGDSYSGTYVQTDSKGRKFRLEYDAASLEGLLDVLGQRAADDNGGGEVATALRKDPKITVKLNKKRTSMKLKAKFSIEGTADGDTKTRKGTYSIKLKGDVSSDG